MTPKTIYNSNNNNDNPQPSPILILKGQIYCRRRRGGITWGVGSARDDIRVQNVDKKVDDDESTVGVVGAEAEE